MHCPAMPCLAQLCFEPPLLVHCSPALFCAAHPSLWLCHLAPGYPSCTSLPCAGLTLTHALLALRYLSMRCPSLLCCAPSFVARCCPALLYVALTSLPNAALGPPWFVLNYHGSRSSSFSVLCCSAPLYLALTYLSYPAFALHCHALIRLAPPCSTRCCPPLHCPSLLCLLYLSFPYVALP